MNYHHWKSFFNNEILSVTKPESWFVLSDTNLNLRADFISNDHPEIAFMDLQSVDELIEEERKMDDSDLLDIVTDGRTVEEYLNQFCTEEALTFYAEQLQLKHVLNRGLKLCSSGEIRKVILIRTLSSVKPILIFSNITEALDVSSRKIVLELLKEKSKSAKIVLISSRLENLKSWFDKAILIEQNQVIHEGSGETLLNENPIKLWSQIQFNLPNKLPGENQNLIQNDPVFVLKNGKIQHDQNVLFEGLNWEFGSNEHWIITGANGCGKSSLLSLISGDHPQVYTNDLHIFGYQRGRGESIWDIKNHIGLISSLLHRDYRVPTSVLNVVISGFFDTIGIYQTPSYYHKQQALEWLALLNFEALANSPFNKLDYGAQRIVLLLRAMVKQPKLLLLDEPLVGIDFVHRSAMLRLIDFKAQNGYTQIIYVSHHEEDEKLTCINRRLDFIGNGEILIS